MDFRFRQFGINQDQCAMKVGTDGVLLGAWAAVPEDGHARLLDIGTGTGLLALMLAQRYPEAYIDCIEIDSAAARQAAENMAASPWPNRLQLTHAAVQDVAPSRRKKYDLIVCNPPFYDRHSPPPLAARRAARDVGSLNRGQLLACVQTMLKGNGRFALILPYQPAEITSFLSQSAALGLMCARQLLVEPVVNRPPNRVLLELAYGSHQCQRKRLAIRLVGGRDRPTGRPAYTDEFRQLTAGFYLSH